MSVRLDGDRLFLEGDCGVEDAEPVAAALGAPSPPRVDLSRCRQLHSAVVQALLAYPAEFEGAPAEDFLNRFLLPAIIRARAASCTGRPFPPQATETFLDSPE
ncbi:MULTISPECIES: hypothetical protein [unclassified Brevundimonas]|uniref:hypothetical protein n=1 Tax=unclassified Brevundimonas TaxID=2622653 RepID=UPI0025C0CF86|nr:MULTISPECIES: hypothetical protein [unclassified Brevundimonas]